MGPAAWVTSRFKQPRNAFCINFLQQQQRQQRHQQQQQLRGANNNAKCQVGKKGERGAGSVRRRPGALGIRQRWEGRRKRRGEAAQGHFSHYTTSVPARLPASLQLQLQLRLTLSLRLLLPFTHSFSLFLSLTVCVLNSRDTQHQNGVVFSFFNFVFASFFQHDSFIFLQSFLTRVKDKWNNWELRTKTTKKYTDTEQWNIKLYNLNMYDSLFKHFTLFLLV